MKKYKLKFTKRDLENLEYGLPISNSLIIVLRSDGSMAIDHWSGAGGSYFSGKEHEFPKIRGLDIIEITMPDGTKHELTVPFNYYGLYED